MVEEHQLSERRACSLVGLSRDSYRNPPQPDQLTRDLGERIVDIAHVRRRFGYRRIHDLLRSELPGVNHKRVYRLYSNANQAVRHRKKVKWPPNERVPLQIAREVNGVWSMHFVSESSSKAEESNASQWVMTSATSELTLKWTFESPANMSLDF
jgi:putative transposase